MSETRVGEGYGPLTANMVARLDETRPWVLLVGILGYCAAALLVVAALGVALMGAFVPARDLGAAFGVLLGLLYLLIAVIYFFVALKLVRYAGAIKRLVATREAVHMEQALEHQRSFWRIVGIISLIYIGLAAIGVLFALVAAIAGFAAS